MGSGVSVPVSADSGFAFDEVQKLFKQKCRIYFSTGHFVAGDPLIPFTKTENLALYTGEGCVFQPLGMMDAGIGKFNPKRNSVKVDFYDIPTDAAVGFELNTVRVYPDMLDWLDTDEAKGELTLLFVPDGDDGSVFLALSGVGLIPEGNINLNGDLATIKLSNEQKCNDITDVVRYKRFELDAVTELAIAEDGTDIDITWTGEVGFAGEFEVWSSTAASGGHWTLVDTVAVEAFTTPTATSAPYYKVVAVLGGEVSNACAAVENEYYPT